MDQSTLPRMESDRLIRILRAVQAEMGSEAVATYVGFPFTVWFYTDGWHLWARRDRI